jgi:hypothetical protein
VEANGGVRVSPLVDEDGVDRLISRSTGEQPGGVPRFEGAKLGDRRRACEQDSMARDPGVSQDIAGDRSRPLCDTRVEMIGRMPGGKCAERCNRRHQGDSSDDDKNEYPLARHSVSMT